jgi:hypothetical protein
MWCAVAVISVGLIMPNDPKALHPLLITQLQEFAWTEGTLQQRIQVSCSKPVLWLWASKWCLIQ